MLYYNEYDTREGVFMSRIKIVTGHFGSGKTEIAINLATEHENSIIVDLDTVNPYYRTAEHREKLNSMGVEVIASEFAASNVDIPTLPAEIIKVFSSDKPSVIDVGGDDDGAFALGRYKNFFEENDYEMYFVICGTRPLTKTADDVLEMMQNIEGASRLKITHLINNTHLAQFTDKETVMKGQALAEEVSRRVGVPIIFTTAPEDIKNQIENEIANPVKGLKLYINMERK